MTFLYPQLLWLLLVLPLLIAAYILLLRRRSKAAVRYADLSLVAEAIGSRRQLRRHIPPLLLLLALAALALAITRPSATITLPTEHRTIILAMDVSRSMRATDVQPNRIVASQTAAKGFIKDLPSDIHVGIVTFAVSASAVQQPTPDHDALLQAIDAFKLQFGTATGSGLIVSLAMMFPDAGIDVEALTLGPRSRFGWRSRDEPEANAPINRPRAPAKAFTPVAPGSYPYGAIVLLSDGRRTTGPDPIDAARMAADRGVRVYTVGFGTKDGTANFGEFGGSSAYFRLDEEALKTIAGITKGEYFYAGTAEDLKKVYEKVNNRLAMEKKQTEITALLAALAALLLIAAIALSLAWSHRSV